MPPSVRDCRLPEDLDALTRMLHRAYAELAAEGMRYTATWQTPEITERRVRSGHCYVAEIDGTLVGTLTVAAPGPDSSIPTYRDPHTWHFGQFGVDPDHRGLGIGRQLHQVALDHAARAGARWLALDTAECAHRLIATYTRWGYREVGRHDSPHTNYVSVVLRRPVTP